MNDSRTLLSCGVFRSFLFFVSVLYCIVDAEAVEWISLVPNPGYSRDLAMGTATVALSYPPQSQSINPAGLSLYRWRSGFHASFFLNGGGVYQACHYLDEYAAEQTGETNARNIARMLTAGAAVQLNIATISVLTSQPVMKTGDVNRYHRFEGKSPLAEHQNSILASLALHPQVSVGGRVDRYYEWDTPKGDAYSYGVILRPRGVDIGVQYQRFPESGARSWHPLDRRADESTTAGLALERRTYTLTAQVMNLTRTGGIAFLEPHAGLEWRPITGVALRGGGTQFSRSSRWAWTAGMALFDQNTIRGREKKLMVPDEVIQGAVGIIYQRKSPEIAFGSLTVVWRF